MPRKFIPNYVFNTPNLGTKHKQMHIGIDMVYDNWWLKSKSVGVLLQMNDLLRLKQPTNSIFFQVAV